MMLTVITPVYNREKLIVDAFESLKRQTRKDFQWIIVDDGSADGTLGVVERFHEQNPGFEILVLHKENGGKHTALNFSRQHIKNDIILILDSDDQLSDDAVENIYKYWDKYWLDDTVGMIRFQAGPDFEHSYAVFPPQETRMNTIDFHYRLHRTGDCNEVFRATMFIKFLPYPEYEGERVVGDHVLWIKAAFETDTVYVPKIICKRVYQEGGWTKSGRRLLIRNCRGSMYGAKVLMDKRIPLIYRLKYGLLYNCYAHFANIGIQEVIKESDAPAIVLISYMPGWLLYFFWKIKYAC